MGNTRLTPLGRLTSLVVGLTLLGVAGAAGAAATRPHDQEWRCVVVRPGDTLWDLAASADGDVRSTVIEVAEHNRLSSAAIQPGVGLWLPAEAVDASEAADSSACGPHR